MSELRVRASDPADGYIHRITPQSAGWTYVGFDVLVLKAGETKAAVTPGREACLVVITGKITAKAGGLVMGTLGERISPFEAPGWSVYVPANSSWEITALTDCEIGVCTAPGSGLLPPRVIPPSEVGHETRGVGTNTRFVRNILPDSSPHAESLLVVEVITPGGNWSSYPPHKHERDALPEESLLEETYYHRIHPPQGYAVQRVYTDDRSLDETVLVEDRDVVLVPRGYHPVGAAHGYDLYYLNVMAGPRRIWRFHNDPNHAWLMAKPKP
jgi:5-deoxy-glucuronate isomerase